MRSQIFGVIYDLVGSSKKDQRFVSTTAHDQSKSIVGIPASRNMPALVVFVLIQLIVCNRVTRGTKNVSVDPLVA